jgi:hypothetical protein
VKVLAPEEDNDSLTPETKDIGEFEKNSSEIPPVQNEEGKN